MWIMDQEGKGVFKVDRLFINRRKKVEITEGAYTPKSYNESDDIYTIEGGLGVSSTILGVYHTEEDALEEFRNLNLPDNTQQIRGNFYEV